MVVVSAVAASPPMLRVSAGCDVGAIRRCESVAAGRCPRVLGRHPVECANPLGRHEDDALSMASEKDDASQSSLLHSLVWYQFVVKAGRARAEASLAAFLYAPCTRVYHSWARRGSSPRRTACAFAAARRRRRGTAGRWAYPWRRMSGTAWGASRAAAGASALLCISLLGRFVMISIVILLRYRVLLVSGMRLGLFKSAREGCSE
jgi:hypothetical protein